MKTIVEFWIDVLESRDKELDHTRLRSDCGFLLYAGRPCPGMKPYVKVLDY